MQMKSRFGSEAQGNQEMGYSSSAKIRTISSLQYFVLGNKTLGLTLMDVELSTS